MKCPFFQISAILCSVFIQSKCAKANSNVPDIYLGLFRGEKQEMTWVRSINQLWDHLLHELWSEEKQTVLNLWWFISKETISFKRKKCCVKLLCEFARMCSHTHTFMPLKLNTLLHYRLCVLSRFPNML